MCGSIAGATSIARLLGQSPLLSVSRSAGIEKNHTADKCPGPGGPRRRRSRVLSRVSSRPRDARRSVGRGSRDLQVGGLCRAASVRRAAVTGGCGPFALEIFMKLANFHILRRRPGGFGRVALVTAVTDAPPLPLRRDPRSDVGSHDRRVSSGCARRDSPVSTKKRRSSGCSVGLFGAKRRGSARGTATVRWSS